MSSDLQCIIFTISNEQYAINIHHVQEIINLAKICETPNSTRHYLKGVINVRGSVIPVISVCKRLGKPELEPTKHTRIIITEYEGQNVGIVVDKIKKTEFLTVGPLPDSTNDSIQSICTGISYIEDEIIPIIKLPAILEMGRD